MYAVDHSRRHGPSILEGVRRGTYDALTLSNVLDGPGPGPACRERLLGAARAALRPGGVLVLRSMRELPTTMGPHHAAEDRSMLWKSVAVCEMG
ncbi:hypothetical protein ABZ769_31380 [Streptomyces olivoreticuli]